MPHPDPDREQGDISQSLATLVKQGRKARRLTQTEFALLAGVGRRFLSELENGKPTVRLREVSAVLTVLGKRLALAPLRRDEA